MNIQQLILSLLLVFMSSLGVAQSVFVHSISASAGVSVPIGKFADDSQGEGHGFANTGLVCQVFYQGGREERRLSFVGGVTVITNPLDEKGYLAMWPQGVTIESKNHRLFGVSGGIAWSLVKSEDVTWQLRATLGAATIHYPAHVMRVRMNDNSMDLVYRTTEDNIINLAGMLGSSVQSKISPRLHLGVNIDLFRSRSNHEITFIQNTFPPNLQHIKQPIALVNIQGALYYRL